MAKGKPVLPGAGKVTFGFSQNIVGIFINQDTGNFSAKPIVDANAATGLNVDVTGVVKAGGKSYRRIIVIVVLRLKVGNISVLYRLTKLN